MKMKINFKLLISGICFLKSVACIINRDFENFANLISIDSYFFKKTPFYDFNSNTSFRADKPRNELILKLFRGELWSNEAKIVHKNDFLIYQPFELLNNNSHLCNLRINWLKNAFFEKKPQIKPSMRLDIKNGQNIGIVCPYCKKKLEKFGFIFWYRMNLVENQFGKKYAFLESNSNNERLIINDKILYINDFQADDSGIYFCITDQSFRTNKSLGDNKILKIKKIDEILHGDQVNFPFKLDYVLMDQSFEPNQIIILNESYKFKNQINYLEMDIINNKKVSNYSNKFRVHTVWQEWSIFETYNLTKLRKRIGECRVSYQEENDSFDFFKYMERAFFPDGWSCYSSIHFRYILLNTTKIEIFTDYLEFDHCKTGCDSSEIENAKSENLLQDLQDLQELKRLDEQKENDDEVDFRIPKIQIQKNSIKRFKGENVKLFCLDYKFVQTDLIEWLKNGVNIQKNDRKLIENKSVQHIFNEYEISQLSFKDSGVYECLLNKKLIVSIELTVESRLIQPNEDDFNKKYEVLNDFLFEIFSIISVLSLFVIFLNLISNLILKKNILDKKNEEKIKLLNIYNYLKLNLDYFEKEVLNEFVKNQNNFDIDDQNNY